MYVYVYARAARVRVLVPSPNLCTYVTTFILIVKYDTKQQQCTISTYTKTLRLCLF